MSNRETDILQIRKYLNGELDAKAMHLLEKRAQDDPFLMDALEGYESIGSDQQINLDDLSGRLKQRVEQKKARIIPLWFSIAASVLIIFSAGVWWLFQGGPSYKKQNKALVAKMITPATKPAPADVISSPVANSETVGKAKASVTQQPKTENLFERRAKTSEVAQVPVAPKPNDETKVSSPAEKDTTPVDEMIVMNYSAQKKKDTVAPVAMLKEIKIKKSNSNNPVQALQGRAPGVTIHSNSQSAAELNKLVARGAISADAANQLLAAQTITGKVIGQDNGLPIAGASVKVAGTDKATRTDANGYFAITADSSKDKLVVATDGYQTRKVSATRRDSAKNIALKPANDDLSEVVVTDYTAKAKDADGSTVVYAHPGNGWSSFKKYLKENAISPDGKNGVVKLSFTVSGLGNITDVKVIKGLSKATDQKAVDLLKNGPTWAGSTTGQPEKLNLRIRFGN